MAKREFLMNPLAVSVALTLGLVGCGGSDDPITITPPPPPVSKSQDVTFDVAVTGQAVKGTLRGAHVTVMGVDATGHEMAIPFRLASGTKTYATGDKPAGTSDETLQAVIDQMVLADNPAAGMTGEMGEFTVYLKHGYAGPVKIMVSSTKGDGSWMRCDSYSGCGEYDQAASPVLPNNGDLDVDFGEWYNDTVELSALSLVNAADTTANISLYTHLVAQNLLNNGAVTEQSIADAGALVVQQLMFSALAEEGTAAMMADFSKADAIDLSDLGDDTLNSGVLSLLTLSSSLQASAVEADVTLAELIAQLSASINAGTFSADSSAAAVVALAPAKVQAQSSQVVALKAFLENVAKRAAQIFVAIINNDTDALASLGVKEASIKSIKTAINRALSDGVLSTAEASAIAARVQAAVSKLGCTDDPATEANECSLTGAADAITEQLIKSVTAEVARITTRNGQNKAAIDALQAANVATGTAPAADAAIEAILAYYNKALAAYSKAYDDTGKNVIGATALRTKNNATLLLAAAKALKARKDNATTQQLFTDATALLAAATVQSDRVNGAEATDEHNIAKANFDKANALMDARKADAKAAAYLEVVAAVEAMRDINDAEKAELDDAIAKYTAVQNYPATNYQQAVINDAQAKAAKAVIDNGWAMWDTRNNLHHTYYYKVVNLYTKYSSDANFKAKYDEAHFLHWGTSDGAYHYLYETRYYNARPVVAKVAASAAEKLAYFTNLEAAKVETQKGADAQLITAMGKKGFDMAIRVLGNVLDEAVAHGDTGDAFVDSNMMPGWSYKYNKTARTLELKEVDPNNATLSTLKANIDFANADGKTTATLGWNGKVMVDDTTMAEFMGSASAGDCTTAWASNSCFAIQYTGTIDGIDGMKGGIEGRTYSNTSMKVTDGDIVVTGMLSHDEQDVATDMKKGYGKFEGKLGDWAFGFNIDFDDQTEMEKFTFHSGDKGYMVEMTSSAGDNFSGTMHYGSPAVQFAEVEETRLGAPGITYYYVDGTTSTYQHIRFVKP